MDLTTKIIIFGPIVYLLYKLKVVLNDKYSKGFFFEIIDLFLGILLLFAVLIPIIW